MRTNNPRRPTDVRSSAEAAFKAATTKPAEPAPKAPVIPNAREQVTLRIDSAALQHFQAAGPGWQDRINDALRKAAGIGQGGGEGLAVDKLNAENDG